MRIGGKKITLIASDFDGTIIKPGMDGPSERFYELINTCLAQDIFFVAASGRQYSNLYKLLRHLDREIAYISENGSLVTYQGNVVYKALIEQTLAMELLADLQQERGCDIMVSGQDTSYMLAEKPGFVEYVEKTIGNHCCMLKSFEDMEEPMIKIAVFFPDGIPEELENRYHAKYDENLQVVNAGNRWFDFIPKESGKGHALSVLAEKLGLDLQQSVTFGDAENDISMLQTGAVSFAMDTAMDNVKKQVDYICDCVEDVLQYGLEQEQVLKEYAIELAGSAGQSSEEAYGFWESLSQDEKILEEFEYFYIHRDFLCKHKVAGYSVVDLLVWQVDHFKAYLDRHFEVKRYDRDQLVFAAFDTLLKMRTNPKFYTDKLEGETGTDYEGKY